MQDITNVSLIWIEVGYFDGEQYRAIVRVRQKLLQHHRISLIRFIFFVYIAGKTIICCNWINWSEHYNLFSVLSNVLRKKRYGACFCFNSSSNRCLINCVQTVTQHIFPYYYLCIYRYKGYFFFKLCQNCCLIIYVLCDMS